MKAAIETVPGTADRRRLDADLQALVGSRCPRCQAPAWPARAVCHRCGVANEIGVAFAPTGIVLTSTTVHVALDGVAAPYELAQVRIDENGPVVFAHLREHPGRARSAAVELVLGAPDEVPYFWFEPRRCGES